MFTRIGWPGSGRHFSWQASIFTSFDTLLLPDIFSLLVSNLAIPSQNTWSYTCGASTLFAVWTVVSVQITGRCQGATLVGGYVDTIMPTCSSLCIAAEPLPGLDPDLLIDEEGSH